MRSAFLIGGSSSACGKSTITMGLNRLLKRKGYEVQPFKCGPDYIDPGFHSLAAGRQCRNLDTRLMSDRVCQKLFHFHSQKCDISTIEGVMGYFDGEEGLYDRGSSYDLAKKLNIPSIIVLDVRASAQSAGAMALGFQKYRGDAPIAGFILNRVGSDRHKYMVTKAVEEATGLPVFGCLPKSPHIELPSRHLGLSLAFEAEARGDLEPILEGLADLLEENLDLEKLLEATLQGPSTQNAQSLNELFDLKPLNFKKGQEIKIGIAMDRAFSFYYEDNLDILRALGAKLIFFSPLKDKKIPENCSALYFGGGYPELYGEALSANLSFIKDLKAKALKGLPIYGECGGYMYLAQSIKTKSNQIWPMVNILPGCIEMNSGLRALGYGEVQWQKDTIIGLKGQVAQGHLFHWSSINKDHLLKDFSEDERDSVFRVKKGDDLLNEGFTKGNVLASYMHFHFASNLQIPLCLLKSGIQYRIKNNI